MFFFNGFSQHNSLIKYYDGDLKLTEKQVDSLVTLILKESDSEYLRALAHYQRGVLQGKKGEDIEEFGSYALALELLKKTDTTDNYLLSAIWRNQGVILHNYKLYKEAVSLYKKALEPSYEFSLVRGISTEFNLGYSLIYYDPKKALSLFMELKDKAKDDINRQARILNQIGLFYKRTEQYDVAIATYTSGLELGVSGRIKANLLQNISDAFYHKQDYSNHEQYLLQVLEVPKGNRFVALMDLGECYILQGRDEEALDVLLRAEGMYNDQSLNPQNIKVFKWLRMVSDNPMKYADRQVEELTRYIERADKLKDMMKTLAMKNVLVAAETEQQSKKQISYFRISAILSSAAAVAIFLVWRIRLIQLRKSLSKRIVKLLEGRNE